MVFELHTFSPGLEIDKFPDYVKPLIPAHQIKNYHGKKLGIIDSGVYQLKLRKKYPILDYPLNTKHYWVIPDYPADLLDLGNNIELTWNQINKYHKYKNAIPVVQSNFMSFSSFITNFKKMLKLQEIHENAKIGIGNCCRLFKNKNELNFGKKIIDYIDDYSYNFHIFGLGTKLIKYIIQNKDMNKYSIDTTKWTRKPNTRGIRSAKSKEKNEYLMYYINYLKIEKYRKFYRKNKTKQTTLI